MITGKVTSTVELAARHPALDGAAFLQIRADDGTAIVAADLLRAPVGSRVLLCRGEAAQSLLGCACPVDAAVAGVLAGP